MGWLTNLLSMKTIAKLKSAILGQKAQDAVEEKVEEVAKEVKKPTKKAKKTVKKPKGKKK